LKALGLEILNAKYESNLSSYVFENPQEISARESAIDSKWEELSKLAEEKKAILDDHLARQIISSL
jgi:hypothetical protein